MFKKVICLFFIACTVGVQCAAIVAAPAAIVSANNELAEDASPEYDAHPQYSFQYSVNDDSTGDHKSQTETRDGDVVSGQYTLAEPDGSIRKVDYTADPINGFNAHVQKIAPAKYIAPVVTPVVAPAKIIAQPAIVQPAKLIAAPVPAKIITTAPVVASAKYYASAPIVAAPAASYVAPARYAYSAPIYSHAPLTAAFHAAPLTAAYHAAPYYTSASYPFAAYHAPAAAYIHH